MKVLYIMGGSGSGKTTLAKQLEEFRPDLFKRTITYTTRPKREEEKNKVDYYFVSDEKFEKLRIHMFEVVDHQFLPYKYGGLSRDLDKGKWNVVVASIEGFLSGMKTLHPTSKDDRSVLLNILIDDELDVNRENRNPKEEENINLSVLRNIKDIHLFDRVKHDTITINGKVADYIEVKLSDIKAYRGNEKELVEKIATGLEDVDSFLKILRTKE